MNEAIIGCPSPLKLIIEVKLFLLDFFGEVGHLGGLGKFFTDFVVHGSRLLLDAVLDVVQF